MTATPVTNPVERYLAEFEQYAANGVGAAPGWLKRLRAASMQRFSELGFPSTKQEQWRFTSVKPIVDRAFTRPREAHTILPEQLSPYLIGAPGPRLVFVNGQFTAAFSSIEGLPVGVIATSLGSALTEHPDLVQAHLGQHVFADDNPFVALNTAFANDGAVVFVSKNVTVAQPLEIVYFSTSGDEPVVSHARTLIVLEENAALRVVETYAGVAGRAYLTNAVTEIAVGGNARLDAYRIQRESESAYHVATTSSVQARDSWYSLTPMAFGSALARHDIWMKLDGEGGEGTLNGLYLLRDAQHADHSTVIEHAQPHCDSREYFNGVLNHRSRAVFNGRIIVRPGAQKTDSKQTNNNLLLSKNARADSQPQLEIYADDVRCTHGATLGPLDENGLFYLRSRGLGPEAARALMTYGFGVEILNRIDIPELRDRLDHVVKDRLASASSAGGF